MMARSRSPIGSSMSQSSRMRSTCWAEKMFRGKGWPSLGSSSSEAGLCSRWLPGHPSEPHPQGDQARVLCPYPADAKQRGFSSVVASLLETTTNSSTGRPDAARPPPEGRPADYREDDRSLR